MIAGLTGVPRLDGGSAPQAVAQMADDAGVDWVAGTDPCVLPKARKNTAEIAGMRAAHLRDAAAMCRFLAWYDAADQTTLTEIDLVTQLEGFRRETNMLRDISFDTIAGAGPNGALPHYRVTDQSNRQLKDGDLIVLDSGGQYPDGTTDITRTLCVGTAGAEEKRAFTLVLKGMIAVSITRFPAGVAGAHLDVLARDALWRAGMDYDHGTGHGVGAALCVHEGPQRLSRAGQVPLDPGMILSNEPGYYREGAFGIRIENLIVVQDAPPLAGADARRMYDFETLTFVPIERRLIDLGLLTGAEREWIDSYHQRCRDKIGPLLSGETALWLRLATEKL
jgi:Xaa-Pro aminopeptidase